MKILFEKLAEELGDTTFNYVDYKVAGASFSKLPITVYSLEIKYKENLIKIENELGNHNLGKVELIIRDKQLPEFEVTNTNHFINLFLRRKKMLNIECRNVAFKNYLTKKIIDSNLEKIAKDNLFEPRITSKINKFNSEINTLYHLEFEDKIGAIKALVNLYKELIDY